MPNCFSLYPKGSDQAAILQHVDDEMCHHFKVEPDPVKYLCGWFDSIGFRVAIGKTFQQIRVEFEDLQIADPDPEGVYTYLLMVLDYLDERYTTDAWAEIDK